LILTAAFYPGAHGNPVVFLHPKDTGGVLVELEETTNF
jgi:methylmalonyl-CoA/ethylmalonyl-CoA epimerase